MEVEELDDDMVVLIVGDEGDASTDDGEPAIKVEKSEITDEESDPMVEYLETGEKLSVKRETLDDEDANDPVWSEDELSLRGFDEEEHLEDFVSVDGDYRPKKNPANDGTKRTRMIKPSARRSHIQEMIKECPSLRYNEEELVKKVANIMMNTKPPKPPSNFYTCENDDEGSFYVCTSCNKKGSNVMELARHWQDQHGERYLKCLACGVDFRATSCLQRHEKRCVAMDAIIVLKARAIAVGNKGRDRPFLKPKTGKKKIKYQYKRTFNCSMCPATFTSRMPLDAHENLHRGERPYMCEFCLMPYASYMALSRHRQIHSDQVFVCDHCERPFKTKHLLISHMLTHNEGRFVCNQCGNKYSTKLARDHHVWRVHLKLPPPAACPVCPKRYARNSNLKVHMKVKHGMELITRNMYIKSLPRLTEMELEKAKVIMNSESTEFPYIMLPEDSIVQTNGNKKGDKRTNKQKITEPQVIQINMDKHEMITGDLVNNEHQNDDDDENQVIVDITDTGVSADVLEFVQNLQADAVEEGRKVKVILMDNGSVVHLVEFENDATKLLGQFKEKGAQREKFKEKGAQRQKFKEVLKSEYRETTNDLVNDGGSKSVILQIQKEFANTDNDLQEIKTSNENLRELHSSASADDTNTTERNIAGNKDSRVISEYKEEKTNKEDPMSTFNNKFEATSELIPTIDASKDDWNVESNKIKNKASDVERQSEDVERQVSDVERKASVLERQSEDVERQSEDVERQSEDVERQSEDVERQIQIKTGSPRRSKRALKGRSLPEFV